MIRGILNKYFRGSLQDRKVLIFGIDASGKTAILYKLLLGECISTIPTIGFNVESIPNTSKTTCFLKL
jgi:hypothetical protein